MRHLLLYILITLTAIAFADSAPLLKKTVLTVDEDGNLNVDGVATVTDITTNAVSVLVSAELADVAQSTASGITNALSGVVQSIMQDNSVVYRYEDNESFAAFVVADPANSNKVIITDFTHTKSGTTLNATLRYVCTINLGAQKPIVYANSELDVGKPNFPIISDSNVSTPVFHTEEVVVAGETYTGYYEISFSVNNLTADTRYFFWVKIDPDAPRSDDDRLSLPNGVTGGLSTVRTFGGKTLTFTKGILTGVSDE